jgi:hypothetical protein
MRYYLQQHEKEQPDYVHLPASTEYGFSFVSEVHSILGLTSVTKKEGKGLSDNLPIRMSI